MTSLFCSGKQTFSIYRSLHLTKRAGALDLGGCTESLSLKTLAGPELVNDSHGQGWPRLEVQSPAVVMDGHIGPLTLMTKNHV